MKPAAGNEEAWSPVEIAEPAPARRALALVPSGSPYLPTEMSRFGVGTDTWSPEAGQHGVAVADPTMKELGEAVALAAADALRDGVQIAEIILLPLQGWKRPDGTEAPPAFVPQRDRQMQRLDREMSDLARRAENARRNSEDSRTEEERRSWLDRAKASDRAARRLRRELAELRAKPADELDLPALANGDPVAYALTRVARAEPADDLAETFAVQQIVRDLCIAVQGLLLHGSFMLAVPTATRLLIVGPVHFSLPNRCRNGAALLLQHVDFTERTMAPAFRTRAERQRLVARLRARPLALSRAAAETAANAYFAAVPRLLLGERSGERARAWDDPDWAEHVRRMYRRRSRPAGGPWLTFEVARQGLSYAVADATEPLSRAEVVKVLERYGVPNAARRVHQYTADKSMERSVTSGSWTWPPAVLRVPGPGRGRDGWHAELRRCPLCRSAAELVVNAPELPYACMCPCGGAPGVRGRVPLSYVALAATREELSAALAAALSTPA